jgi:CRP-like cAMP-binding protein
VAKEPTPTALELLARNPVLGLGSPAALEQLAEASTVRRYAAGATVTIARSPQTHVLVLAEGKLALKKRNREAKTQLLVGVIVAPAIYGDAEAYSATRRWVASARAAEPTLAVQVPNRALDAFVEREGKAAAALYRDACARHYLAVELMQVHALQKTQHKILRLLMSQATGPGREVQVRPAQLAAALGVNRKTVARNLALLEEQGLLARHGRAVELKPDRESFAALQGGLGARWELER